MEAVPIAQVIAQAPASQLASGWFNNIPVADVVGDGQQAAPVNVRPVLPPGVRRHGSASHLRALTPQEVIHVLIGQLSALMDSKDSADWTINPAFHPEVNAFIARHASNPQFVNKARALQKNRAPYYAKMVVPGVKRQTILNLGRHTAVAPPRR
ncbi:MAG: hypothetical protein JNM56_07335 [Planctomycetia bacterium]|nr:hypothetical protein [Planctomycetia bacterium]